jgi:hypothetical protein
LALAVDRFTGLGVSAGRVDRFGAVPEGSEFAARIYAAINTRDRGAIKALSDPDIVVGTTVEAYRGAEALLEWLDEGDDAFDDFTVELLAVEELAGHLVGIDAPARPRKGERCRGRPPLHPQMLQLSLDGRRLYVTNSLYSSWDNQFYPELRSWLLKVNCHPEGGMEVDRDFFVDFHARPDGPARAHEVRLQGGDCTTEIFQ